MRPLAHDIAVYLGTAGVGEFNGSGDWAIFAHVEPATPNKVITVYDTGGEGPDTDELDLLRLTFQVRIRSESYAEAHSRHESTRDVLLVGRIETSDSVYVGIDMTSDIAPIGMDDNKRHILVANYRAIRERT